MIIITFAACDKTDLFPVILFFHFSKKLEILSITTFVIFIYLDLYRSIYWFLVLRRGKEYSNSEANRHLLNSKISCWVLNALGGCFGGLLWVLVVLGFFCLFDLSFFLVGYGVFGGWWGFFVRLFVWAFFVWW